MIPRIGRFLSRHRRHYSVRRLDHVLLQLHRGYENKNYDICTNGEMAILVRLAGTGNVKTVFDVGANRGEWCDLAIKLFPGAEIHAFEIVPETFNHLQRRFGSVRNVVLNGIGLSNREGPINVYFLPEHHALATCVAGFSEWFHGYYPTIQRVSTITGDHYCTSKGIEAIDFLKIDVEGFEPQVLRGFKGMLSRARIDVIQFEYGYVNIDTHFLLKDFYELFSQAKMVVGKIYPTYVDFRPYRYVDEDFYGPNFLAVRSDRQDLLTILGAS